MKRQQLKSQTFFLLLGAFLLFSNTAFAQKAPYKLILQITVDGLRADLLSRYNHHFENDGFGYLLKNGVVYRNAHYAHANTETIVGHATLATGAHPATHGMIGNAWFDRSTGALRYNIEDADFPLLPVKGAQIGGAQIDPAQKAAKTNGRSPRAIITTTFSDQLGLHYGGRSKIFGVSGKDRSAVAMAGHGGKAFWYSTDSGKMVTSEYYYDSYPSWVSTWNEKSLADEYSNKYWDTLYSKENYLFRHQDDRPYEVDLKGYGRTFPHPFGDKSDKLFYTRLLVSPMGDSLLLDFTKDLVRNEKLGQDRYPDYLSVSFSGVDAVNHFFGPSSLENEDTVLQLDRTLGRLLTFIDDEVGLKNTLIVLSADHGMAEMPEYMSEKGFSASRITNDAVLEAANSYGAKRFGITGIARSFFRPNLYLDTEKIEAKGLSYEKVVKDIAFLLQSVPGVGAAVANRVPSDTSNDTNRLIANNFHPERSGDIYIAQAPYWFMLEGGGPIAVMHGSPWNYDTHVPIIVVGKKIKRDRINRRVDPTAIAPTLSLLTGVGFPSGSETRALEEVIR